jgi:putative endonuclease
MNIWKWYVYIIRCADESYYTGLTWDAGVRLEQHLTGLGGRYTAKHKPKELVYLEEYEDFGQARRREYQLKRWTRQKKERLISGEWGKWE